MIIKGYFPLGASISALTPNPSPHLYEGDFYWTKIVDFCPDFNKLLPLSYSCTRGIKGVRAEIHTKREIPELNTYLLLPSRAPPDFKSFGNF
jgi:hypothetical protein